MGPGDLSRVLAPLPSRADPRLLVGRETFDDAGVFLLSDDFALVQTLDFFAPIVDDPYIFGQIAAANALSDVYAMGGEPLTALAIVGFPTDTVPLEVLTDILRGGQDKVHEAGALIIGGHTVVDEEVKYGLAVTGRAHPARLLTNAAARPGDRLVLTKPLGNGILATAAKMGLIALAEQEEMLSTMRSLNRDASHAALECGVRCATDVTGFGLLGHATHVARASGVTIEVVASSIPSLAGVVDSWQRGARTGGAERNAQYVESLIDWGTASEAQRALLVDPQTSGGLLLTVAENRMADFRARLPSAVEIGRVVARGAKLLRVVA